MSRYVVAIFLAGLALIARGAEPPERRIVDLDAPGALEALERANPAHFAKVREILAGVDEQPEPAVEGWIRTSFDASDVDYEPLLLVSNPPKKRLAFTLEGTRYRAVVTLTKFEPRRMPLVDRPAR